jgi:hypothetical protein
MEEPGVYVDRDRLADTGARISISSNVQRFAISALAPRATDRQSKTRPAFPRMRALCQNVSADLPCGRLIQRAICDDDRDHSYHRNRRPPKPNADVRWMGLAPRCSDCDVPDNQRPEPKNRGNKEHWRPVQESQSYNAHNKHARRQHPKTYAAGFIELRRRGRRCASAARTRFAGEETGTLSAMRHTLANRANATIRAGL